MPFDLSPTLALALGCALLAASYIRGYSGFGFSAIFIAFAALFTNPVPLIPVVFICELAMTALQARSISGHIDWRRALTLLAGAAVVLPFSIALVLSLGSDTVRLSISLVIGVMALFLLSGWTLRRPLHTKGHLAVGALSGAANAAGVGGLPVATCLTVQEMPAARFRATMIVFLTGIDLMTLPLMYAGGNVNDETLHAALIAAPLVATGTLLGNRRFAGTPPEAFRRFAVILLLTLAALGVLRALI